ncbi:MAG: PHP domain-containing protein [Methanomassiliicoccales archaeon]
MGKGTVINLHTHTTFSDGLFDIETIVFEGARNGLTHVAITDHFETTKVRSLKLRDFEKYVDAIETIRRKYEGTIEVLAGIEIDTNPYRCDFVSIPRRIFESLDIALFEYVGNIPAGGASIETVGDFASNLPVQCGLAHPDFEVAFSSRDPHELAKKLGEYNFFVEINTARIYRRDGVPYYERAADLISELRSSVKFSIGTDVHRTISEIFNVKNAYEFARRLGISDRLIY